MNCRAPIVLLALGLAPGLALAQTPPQTTAEVEATWRMLVGQAQSAQTAGDHARALELGSRALAIHTSPSLHRFVAQEQAHLGLVVPALTSAQRCVDALDADRRAPERAATLATCTALVRDLQTRVGRVVVDVPNNPPEGLAVTVAGSALPAALYGVPYLVSPGRVTVDATAPGRVALHRSVEVATGGNVTVRVELPPAPPSGTTPRASTDPTPTPIVTPTPAAPARATPRPAPVVERPGSARRTLAWATAIGGAAGLVTGGVLAGLREGAVSSFNDAGCIEDHGVATPTGNCPGDQARANALGPAVAASFAVGGALAAASVILWVTLPSGTSDRAAFACAPTLGVRGVACGARF